MLKHLTETRVELPNDEGNSSLSECREPTPTPESPVVGSPAGGLVPHATTVITVTPTSMVLSLPHATDTTTATAQTRTDANLDILESIDLDAFQSTETFRKVSDVSPGESDRPNARALTDKRGGIALAVAIGVSSALSFAVHALASRQLSVADYGALAAVLAMMTAAAVPVGAVQTALTRSAAEILPRGECPSGRSALWDVVPVSLVVVAFGGAFAPMTANFLNLSSSIPIVLGGSWVAVVLIGSVGKALLIADSSHRPIAHAIAHGSVIRLGAAALLSPIFGVAGGIGAAVIGDIAASLIYLFTAARRGMLSKSGVQVRIEWPDAGRALSAQLSLWLFASLAVVIGRRTLTGPESGSFAAMSTAAVACLFLPQAVATIIFPRFVADGSRRLLLGATVLAGMVGTGCAVVLGIRPDLLFVIFFGPEYVPQREVLLVLCAHFVLLGCLTVLTQYVVARRQGGTLAIWLALAVATISAVAIADSPLSVAVAILLPTIGATIHVSFRGVFSSGWSDTARGDGDTTRNDGDAARADSELQRVDFDQRDGATLGSQFLSLPATIDVSIVVPTYNGGSRLVPCVEGIRGVLDRTTYRYEIVVAVDGSTDGSEQALVGSSANVVVERLASNSGKGAALRHGFSISHGAVIGFIDGDGDISPDVLVELLERLFASTAVVAVASKNQPGARVSATRKRRLMSVAYRMLVHWMFDLKVTDTQCGCKVFRREFLAATIDQARETGFAFDLELLCIGNRLGLTRAIEVPVVLEREERGTVSVRTAMRMFTDTMRIRRRLPPATWAPLPLNTLAPAGIDLSSPMLP